MYSNTVAFSLTPAAYQDISGGYEMCSFRLQFISEKNNVIRVHLGTSLPDPDTDDYDEFRAPASVTEQWEINFTDLAPLGRVYVRANSANVSLKVYRR